MLKNEKYIGVYTCKNEIRIEDAFPKIPAEDIDTSSGFYFQLKYDGYGRIHIILKSSHNEHKCNAYFIPLECEMLIREINEKIITLRRLRSGNAVTA